MVYLILDTNIWLYLANGFCSESRKSDNKHFDLLNTLVELTKKENFHILTNDIIVLEWNRNKKTAYQLIEKLEKKIKEVQLQFHEIRTAIPNKEQQINEVEKVYINSLEKGIEQNRMHITFVENLLKHHCKFVRISDQLKLRIFNMAINKEYPFQKDKNNFADLAILFSSIEFLEDNMLYPEEYAIFVSNNFKEFGDPNNKRLFHPEIFKYVNHIDLSYELLLPIALDLTEDLLNKIESWRLFESCSICCECTGNVCKINFEKK